MEQSSLVFYQQPSCPALRKCLICQSNVSSKWLIIHPLPCLAQTLSSQGLWFGAISQGLLPPRVLLHRKGFLSPSPTHPKYP